MNLQMQTEKYPVTSLQTKPFESHFLSRISRAYTTGIEQFSWLLLLLAVMPGFFINQPSMVITLFRVLVVLPIVVYCACKPAVLLESTNHTPARLFLVFSAYALLTMSWSVDGGAPVELCWNVLSTTVLFMLVFLTVSRQSQHLPQVEKAFMTGGAVCLALSYVDTDFQVAIANLNTGYGVFTHHVYVSWLAGSLALLLLARLSRLSFIHVVGFCACFVTIIFSHGRGGLIAFTTGYLCLMFRQNRPVRDRQAVLCIVIVLCLVYLFFPFHLEKLIGKELNMRPEIWQHGYHKVTQDAVHLWLGAGLNANDNFYLHGFFIPHYHSLYWNQLYYGGVAGLSLYLGMLMTVLYRGFRQSAVSPWWYLLVGMSVALVVDGDHFFMAPSPLFTCFLLPFFMTLFGHDNTQETLDHA
jgi:hypothetical protein